MNKYTRTPKINLANRIWPTQEITEAPRWCSVDLRDGNQALEKPMSIKQKLILFKYLVKMGFKEIEVGFPSASQIEFDFIRLIIEQNHIPDDVMIQVLVPARQALIKRSFEALSGAKHVCIHLYNSTSKRQREVVFKKSKEEIISLAVQGATWIKAEVQSFEGDVVYQYSPESFTQTELDFVSDICNAVIEVYEPREDKKMIINLPSTVENSMPNIYADKIEWMKERLTPSESIIISLHAHNDRGTAVASTEMGLLAGASRVEGTLFGNGERSGNVDLITLIMNMHSQGIQVNIDISMIKTSVEMIEEFTDIQIHKRHPYVGSMIYTAFSGSHQDAIKKGIQAQELDAKWDVPYLPLDPQDLGYGYDALVKINAQSGKGGIAFIMKEVYGYDIPQDMLVDFAKKVQIISDEKGKILQNSEIYDLFHISYTQEGLNLDDFKVMRNSSRVSVLFSVKEGVELNAQGKGVLEACTNAINTYTEEKIYINEYFEHSLHSGSDSNAISYIKINEIFFGFGIDKDISMASIKALISATSKIT